MDKAIFNNPKAVFRPVIALVAIDTVLNAATIPSTALAIVWITPGGNEEINSAPLVAASARNLTTSPKALAILSKFSPLPARDEKT